MNAPSTDEALIIDYLRQFPKIFVSASEVCKRANGRRRYERDPEWARPVLRRMLSDGWLLANEFGQYRLIDEALGERKCNKADRIRRLSEAITVHVMNMDDADDDKPFSILIKEVAQSTWINLDGKKVKVSE